MAIKRTIHAVYDTSYHLVWCPKYRKKIFEHHQIRERAEQLIREICQEYDFELIEMEISTEHIHILLSFLPKRSIGEVVRIIKSISARELFRAFPSLKHRRWVWAAVGRRLWRGDARGILTFIFLFSIEKGLFDW